VPDDNSGSSESVIHVFGRFLRGMLRGILRDLLLLVAVFFLATGVSALACAYYDVPLVFSLAGGIVAMALTLAFLLAIRSESLFYD
jgi:hypothetical protein